MMQRLDAVGSCSHALGSPSSPPRSTHSPSSKSDGNGNTTDLITKQDRVTALPPRSAAIALSAPAASHHTPALFRVASCRNTCHIGLASRAVGSRRQLAPLPWLPSGFDAAPLRTALPAGRTLGSAALGTLHPLSTRSPRPLPWPRLGSRAPSAPAGSHTRSPLKALTYPPASTRHCPRTASPAEHTPSSASPRPRLSSLRRGTSARRTHAHSARLTIALAELC